MSRLNRVLNVTAATMLLCLTFVAVASAQTLEDLRKSGAIGERFDGYVTVRDEAAADLPAKVDEINAKRKAIYEKRATDEGVTADQVGRVYAKQILTDAPAGTWFLQEDSTWLQKE